MTPEEFKAFKRQMDWTHRQCAACFGVDLSTWHNWLAGRTRITASFRPRAARLLAEARSLRGRSKLKRWADAREAEIAARKSGVWFRRGD